MLTRFISQIIIFSLISKILGFSRDLLITYEYGLTSQTDSYFIAVIVCTVFFNLTNSGLISSLMIVSGSIDNQNEKNKYFSNFLIIFFFISLLIAFFLYFFAPNIVNIFAYGFSDDKASLSIRLVKLGSIIVVFNFITSILSAYHQDKKKFITPTCEGILLNIPLIIYLLFLNKIYGIEGLMIATIMGYILQSIVNIISANRFHFSFIPKRKIANHNSVLTFKLLLPIFLGSIAGFINTIVDKTMASDLPDGIISAFSLSLKFRQLFIGLFILSIITPLYSFLTKKINKNEIINLSVKGINLILFSSIPITIFLVSFSHKLITIVFQHGNFTGADSQIVSNSLIFYSIGIIGVGLVGFFTKIFFSLRKPRTPMFVGIFAVILNILLNIILINQFGYIGLPLATSLTSLFSSVLLFYLLRKINIITFNNFSNCLIKCLVSSLISLASVFVILYLIRIFIIPNAYFFVLILFPLFFVIYFAISFLFKLDPAINLVSYLKKIFNK
jgi:putative peptidoglycan lipid II flippase